MLRRNMPEMTYDPELSVRDREIRLPSRSQNHDMRSEKEDVHEPAAAES